MKTRAALAFVALALAAACSRPAPPVLTPRAVKVTALTTSSSNLTVDLDAENPNDIALTARSMTAKIQIDGHYDVGTVKVATPLTLPAHKIAHLTVPLSLHWTDVSLLATMAAQSRSIPYAIDGTVELGGDTLHVDVPFHMTGSVTHAELVAAAISSLPEKIPGLPTISEQTTHRPWPPPHPAQSKSLPLSAPSSSEAAPELAAAIPTEPANPTHRDLGPARVARTRGSSMVFSRSSTAPHQPRRGSRRQGVAGRDRHRRRRQLRAQHGRVDSDLDLRVAGRTMAEASRVADGFLYPLWDMGVAIGHQVVEIGALVDVARTDLPTATPARRLPGLDRGAAAAAGHRRPASRHRAAPAGQRGHRGVRGQLRPAAGPSARVRHRAGPHPAAAYGGRSIERNGINVIAESRAQGQARATCSGRGSPPTSPCSAIAYGAFVARLRRLVLAGRRSPAWSASSSRSRSAASSRWPASAARRRRWCCPGRRSGSRGNALPAALSWLLTVGWETVLVVAGHAGHRDRVRPARLGRRHRHQGRRDDRRRRRSRSSRGVLGFDVIMRLQTWITVVTGVLTVVYIVLAADDIHWSTVSRAARRARPRRSSARWCS